MISVDNFYWLIFENLLKPCGLDCQYFYPFGTLQNLSVVEFSGFDVPRWGKRGKYVMFLDQEPLYTENLDQVDKYVLGEYWHKTCKFLGNSEISEEKKFFCKSRQMLDWYFFYHGFAALDWFRDCQYISDQNEILHPFLCLNHLTRHKRSYRMSLLARMMESGAFRNGVISFHGNSLDCTNELNDIHSELSESCKKIISKTLIEDASIKLPMILDNDKVDGNLSAHLGFHEYRLWQTSLFHVVTETVFYDKKLHLTEKIFKPIVAERPFILVAAPGNLAYLKRYGFRTFDRWIDEKYDEIQDNDARLDHIVGEISRLSNMTLPQLKSMHHEMKEILDFNKRHFFGDFKKIIIDEMVDNFELCLKLWNNGRVNYRCLMHPDLNKAKEILSQ